MFSLEVVDTCHLVTCAAPATGSPVVPHSLKNGRVFQTSLSRVSTVSVTIEYMFGQPSESVRMPRFGLALIAAIVKATGSSC